MNYGFILQPGENITKVVHRSLVSLFPSAFIALLLTAVGAGVGYFYKLNPSNVQFSRGTVIAIVLVAFTLALLVLFGGLYVYSYNVLIFTNLHLVEVEQSDIFSRTISQVSFDREQDISSSQNGIFAMMFNYGSITVQSAGENVHFVFRYAPDPEEVSNEAIATNEASMGSGGQGLG